MLINKLRKVKYKIFMVWNGIKIEVRNRRQVNKRDKEPIYYIIRYHDSMSCGWTVWERVVLYNCIYAVDHRMIPVVDMKSCKSIYQETEEIELVNIWDKYFFQPADISLEEAIKSGNYILGDFSPEWFRYIRIRRKKCQNNEYLRKSFQKYIRFRPNIEDILEGRYQRILSEKNLERNARILGICIRGTDYKQFHEAKQPSIEKVIELAIKVFYTYGCSGIFIATEDCEILEKISKYMPDKKLLMYDAGRISTTNGEYVGDYIRKSKSAYQAAMDYLTVLYCLNKCTCLIGGLCGATIVAKYSRETPYEYINIIDLKKVY